MGNSRVLIVVPARYGSTRLPAKPLAPLLGKPMVQWVVERSSLARTSAGLPMRVVVATDDERIASVVRGFGGEAIMTSTELPSGTDRVAAVADEIAADVYVNVQGDEPLIEPRAIEAGVELVASGRFGLATVMTPIRQASELDDVSVVKVVADAGDRAIYFSRYPIPYSRGARPELGQPFACQRHVGLYVYDRATLLKFRALAPSPLERGESLEQLRALASGIPIGIRQVDFNSVGVDTPEDLDQVRKILERQAKQ